MDKTSGILVCLIWTSWDGVLDKKKRNIFMIKPHRVKEEVHDLVELIYIQ